MGTENGRSYPDVLWLMFFLFCSPYLLASYMVGVRSTEGIVNLRHLFLSCIYDVEEKVDD